MMTNIISNAPFWVWPLFAYLLVIGIKASKPSILTLRRLFVVPIVFFAWALHGIFTHNQTSEISILVLAMLAGCGLGFLMVRNLNMRFDKINRLVEMPGSWTTLILGLSIFCLKFSQGALSTTRPELKGTWYLLLIEASAAVIAGIFAGRGVGYWLKYKTAPQTDIR